MSKFDVACLTFAATVLVLDPAYKQLNKLVAKSSDRAKAVKHLKRTNRDAYNALKAMNLI